MKIKTGDEIYNRIEKDSVQGFENQWVKHVSEKWIKLEDIQTELKNHLEYYKGTKIANFINSFLHGLEIE